LDQSHQTLLVVRMKISYDERVDILWIRLNHKKIAESDEVQPGMIFDYDDEGKIIGIEIHQASELTDDPRNVEFAPAA
jgi:uncharacterized protein YuzE